MRYAAYTLEPTHNHTYRLARQYDATKLPVILPKDNNVLRASTASAGAAFLDDPCTRYVSMMVYRYYLPAPR